MLENIHDALMQLSIFKFLASYVIVTLERAH